METDTVIVGSGAAGATLAKELAGLGTDVVLLEKGPDSTWPLGKIISLMTLYEHTASPPFFPKTREGAYVLRGICTGGSTTIFGGSAFMPPPWLKEDYGIDLTREAQDAIRDIGIAVPPKQYFDAWSSARKFKEAAGDLGLDVTEQMKFLYPGKCPPACDHCAFGCERDARWSSRKFIKIAADRGAKILVRTAVSRVLVEGNRALGVRAHGPEGETDIYADKVVCAAGGLGTPVILQRSGIKEAGRGLSVDPSTGICGIQKESLAPGGTFAVGYEAAMESEGFLISNAGAGIVSLIRLAIAPFSTLRHPGQFNRVLGLFVKISDSSEGRVFEDGSISKPFTKQDEQKMSRGLELCKKILVRAGCEPDRFLSMPLSKSVATHHCGTAALDRVVDRNLETRVKNLFVCDTSVLPKAPGRPTALTAISLATWFAKQLAGRQAREEGDNK